MLLYIAFCLCLVENTASPVRRNNNVNHSVNLIEGEKQWEKVNEKVIPRHLDGVRLERDGNFNKEFDREAFLGQEKKDFDGLTESEGHEKLQKIFEMADKDGDFKLSVHELKNWIQAKINEHYTHSEDENHGKFRELDSNDDGLITWDEYVDHLEVPKETNREMLLMAAEYHGPPANATRTRSPYHKEIDEDSRTQEQVVAAQFIHHTHEKWETADENEDGSLTEKEFLYYHHPEHNRKTLNLFVSDILEGMDKNGDKVLTLQEYVGINIPKDEWSTENEEFYKEREAEFRNMIDNNADGVIDMDELESHLNPRNEQHSYNEAMHLIAMADANHDEKLSLEEVFNNYEVFVGSPMVNVSQSFHDEF